MQAPDAYVLKSELALRKHAVLMHEAPPAKRQRTTNDDQIDACARQYAYVPNSPLSPSRTQTQVTAGEPAGLIEIVGDLADVADTLDNPSPEANVLVIETHDEAAPEQPATAAAAVKDEEAPDPVDCLATSPLQLKDETAAVQHMGVPVPSDINPESRISLKDEPASAQLSEHRSIGQQGGPSTSEAEQDSSDASDQHSVANQATTGHYNGSMPSTTSHATIENDCVHQSSAHQANALQLQPAPSELQEAQLAVGEAGAQIDQPAQPAEANGLITVEQLTAQGQYLLDTAEQQQVGVKLKTYKDQVDDLQRQGRSKPDMIAYKHLKGTLTPPRAYGHIAGIDIGACFGGRGEVAILGIHTQMMRGIDSTKGHPTYAIVMSGGYRDDVDEGLLVNYTGEGGQSKGKQIKDQTWTAGNLALQQSCQQRVPVRVVRGSTENKNGKRELIYTYDGLYCVESAQMEKGQDGFLICKFQLRALPGHSKAGQKVTYGAVKGGRFKQLALVRRKPCGQGRKPALQTHKAVADIALQEERRLATLQARPGLLQLDISNGKEPCRIPVFNEVDTEQPPTRDQLEYLRYDEGLPATETVCATPEARELLVKADAAMQFRNMCGVARAGNCHYTKDGRLWETNKYGIYECAASASSHVARHSCKSLENRVVSRGIQLPLEVFKTANGRGWGVRCARDIEIGTFICDYVGRLITDPQADACQNDEYLFDLDHFVQLANEPSSDVDPQQLPPLPPSHQADADDDLHLVIDARTQGNVARFINHSCQGNLVIQPVFTNGCNVFLYRIALFASGEIPAFTELTYDYGYAEGVVHNRNMLCKCGSQDCRKRLL